MTDLMNNSTHSQHYPTNPNEVAGNRRPARPTSAQQRSTTPTRNRPPPSSTSNGLNTTAKLEQSIMRHEAEHGAVANTSMKLNSKGKNRLYSTWTPLQDDETNARLYDERRQLVNKWYEKWSDEQRRIILEDMMSLSRPRQLNHARNLLSKKFPSHHQDFTRLFPRVLCLYIFSFLDPRSLCRAAQVCWYWKFLSEADQIWMPKCLRFGWAPKYSPSPYETNVWKRLYSFNIQALQTMPVRDSNPRLQNNTYDDQLSSRQPTARSNLVRHHHNQSHVSSSSRPVEHPPWRANSRNPADTLRFNYLDNDDAVLDSVIAKHRKYGTSILQQADSDHDLKNSSRPGSQNRSRAHEKHEHSGSKRRSQSLSARGSPSVSFRDEHTSSNAFHGNHHSFLARPPSVTGVNRPVDIPRPPSSSQKMKSTYKNSAQGLSNHTWHAANSNAPYLDE